jgi:energy-coupling factor transporter ATP-binding protein EcfA2
VLIGLRRGRLDNPLASAAALPDQRIAEGLLAFVGYAGALDVPAGELAHVDRRLVEIARALATAPAVLLLDEPAAGLMRADKAALSTVLRRIADTGLAVILVEHDMTLVMGISDHVVVLDAGRPIAAGARTRCATAQGQGPISGSGGDGRGAWGTAGSPQVSWRPTLSRVTARSRCCRASASRCAAAS